jgi:hypothetical protein
MMKDFRMLCNNFLTLGFGCEHEEVLGFQGRTFSLVFGWGCLHTTIMETRKKSDGDVVVFMALMFLCCFLLFGMSELVWILLNMG